GGGGRGGAVARPAAAGHGTPGHGRFGTAVPGRPTGLPMLHGESTHSVRTGGGETTARPMVFASVPNQISPVGGWKYMCRTVFRSAPLLNPGVLLKNVEVFGSKPTKRLGCPPVSAIQIRALPPTAMAYGRDRVPLGITHSSNCFVFWS